MFEGYYSALVTPFKNGTVDIESFEKYFNHMVCVGISGVVVCGSTGESIALTTSEKISLIKAASKINNNRIKLIAGIIDATTLDCVEIMRNTEDYVDGFLCICPFYIKPSQEQIYQHFFTLSSSTAKSIILYNNPARVGVSISFETFSRLCKHNNVVAIKECGELSRFTTWRRDTKEKFAFLSGNDDTACAALAMGAKGVISVTANVAAMLCVKMFNSFQKNDMVTFVEIRDKLAPLHDAMFAEPSPGPVKYALHKMGLMRNELRLPLGSITKELEIKIDLLMEHLRISAE